MGSGESNFEWWNERAVLRALLVLAALMMVGAAALFSRHNAVHVVPIAGGLTSLCCLTAAWFGRSRSQERWERAWDTYLSLQEREVSSPSLGRTPT